MIKIELKQRNNITVKEQIISFFEQKCSRTQAIGFYEHAELAGLKGGTNMFDAAIDIICEELGLDPTILSKQIEDNTIS